MPARHVVPSDDFAKATRTLDNSLRMRLDKQIEKIIATPDVGKPLRYDMKGERTIYVRPYRLIYKVEGETLFLLHFSHRKEAYK